MVPGTDAFRQRRRNSLLIIKRNVTVEQLKQNPTASILIAIVALLLNQSAVSQATTCIFRQTVVNMDFGTNSNRKDLNLAYLGKYEQTESSCPDDGWLTFTSQTSDCFNGNWLNVPEDHTPGDADGRMLLVNAAETPGMFFANKITGLKAGYTYELSAWFVNVCLRGAGCYPTPPVISISVNTPGKQILKFVTGEISPTGSPVWRKFANVFTVPEGETSVLILMDDITNGGCGNDFAMDDLQLKECVMPEKHKPVVVKKPAPAAKPVVSKPAPQKTPVKLPVTVAPKPIVKEPVITTKNATPIEKTAATQPAPTLATIKEKITTVALPAPVLKRANALVKEIETGPAELVIDLYDNGEIDGDTVTVYHNNQLVVSHAGLSAKPVTFKIKVDELHPYHELLMVADNLGSIPPNTSLMIITAGQKRYEVFISSSEQKNAKLVIAWKKE